MMVVIGALIILGAEEPALLEAVHAKCHSALFWKKI